MSGPSLPNMYPYRNDLNWSRSERGIARKVFDAALTRERQDVMRKAKEMANQIKEPADVWDLENYLTRPRKDIDSRYDFRSSRLTRMLGTLLRECRISEEELRGLRKEKRKAIRSCVKDLI